MCSEPSLIYETYSLKIINMRVVVMQETYKIIKTAEKCLTNYFFKCRKLTPYLKYPVALCMMQDRVLRKISKLNQKESALCTYKFRLI